jgi:2-polyprenyl-6-methoxyphenol hydroxylase-like FAD-dependent oxidoreductase
MLFRTSDQIPVLIVGAGPTGLSLAIELARRGIPFRIIDKAFQHAEHSRALGLQARTLEVFNLMGVADRFVERGHRINTIRLYTGGKEVGNVDFSPLDSPYPFLLVLPQNETERILTERLQHLGESVEWGTELIKCEQREGQIACWLRSPLREENCRAGWLAGCDGAHSAVRQLANIPFEGIEYPEAFALADINLSGQAAEDQVSLHLSEQGMLGIVPIRHGLARVFADLAKASPNMNQPPTLEQIQRILDERGPGNLRANDPIWLSHFHLHRRIVSKFRDGLVFLAGDAAHVHSPVAAQGMNTGIQDAFNLGWKLAAVISAGASPTLLDTYQWERVDISTNVLRGTDWLTRMIMMHHPVSRYLRDHIAKFLSGIKQLQKRVREDIAQVSVAYAESMVVEEHYGGDAPSAGARAPDAAALLKPAESLCSIFSLLRQGGWLLLVFCAGRETEGQSLVRRNQDAPNLKIYPVLRNFNPEVLNEYLVDSDGSLHKKYGITAPCACLIRPDGYIGFRAFLEDTDALENFMQGAAMPQLTV